MEPKEKSLIIKDERELFLNDGFTTNCFILEPNSFNTIILS
ncbi:MULTISPECIES: hypothetical protein [Peribacillus]|nr:MULTISPECIES: hypothetical protein [Peribacillus]MDQ0879470.1 hypothetical protein [Peribacillus sp. V2I11]